MDTGRQKLKNALKNTVLLVLFLSMLVLTFLTWLTDLSMDSVPGDSLLARFYQRFTYGISGFEIRTGAAPVAEPTRIAATGASGLVGAQYHAASVSVLYDALGAQMGDALAACGAFEDCRAEAFAEALRGEVLYFGYEGYLPLALVSDWLGRSVDHAASTDLLLLTADGRLFLHTATGYQVAHTDASLARWENIRGELSAGACSFAAEDSLFAHVRPDTLLFPHENIAAEHLSARQPGFLDGQSGSDLTALLDVFGYDPYVLSYTENADLTRVFVENYSTLHIGADGTVFFDASAMEGGIEAYAPSETGRYETLRLQADFAYQMVKAVQGSMSDNAQAMLFDVAEGKNGVRVLTFIQLVGGIPVETATEQPFARLEFRENKLMAAAFYLRVLEATGARKPVLPSAQAAAAAPAGGLRQALVYVREAEGEFAPRRCYLK